MAKSTWPVMSATLMPVSINRVATEIVKVIKTMLLANEHHWFNLKETTAIKRRLTHLRVSNSL
jgi:hypothetical protein